MFRPSVNKVLPELIFKLCCHSPRMSYLKCGLVFAVVIFFLFLVFLERIIYRENAAVLLGFDEYQVQTFLGKYDFKPRRASSYKVIYDLALLSVVTKLKP